MTTIDRIATDASSDGSKFRGTNIAHQAIDEATRTIHTGLGVQVYDDRFMQRAIALSQEALAKPGTEPFGAVIVRDGQIVGEGLNHSKTHFDPTSHGEVEAIRDACRRLQTVDLSDCAIYTSCEPCAMCVATMTIAGIATMYYGASMEQAGAALSGLPRSKRHPVDVEAVRREAGRCLQERGMQAQQHRGDDAFAVLKAWASQ